VRYEEKTRRYYQKEAAHTLPVVAIKAVAHKLARACYHVMKSGEPFAVGRAFG
jgi:transposase